MWWEQTEERKSLCCPGLTLRKVWSDHWNTRLKTILCIFPAAGGHLLLGRMSSSMTGKGRHVYPDAAPVIWSRCDLYSLLVIQVTAHLAAVYLQINSCFRLKTFPPRAADWLSLMRNHFWGRRADGTKGRISATPASFISSPSPSLTSLSPFSSSLISPVSCDWSRTISPLPDTALSHP